MGGWCACTMCAVLKTNGAVASATAGRSGPRLQRSLTTTLGQRVSSTRAWPSSRRAGTARARRRAARRARTSSHARQERRGARANAAAFHASTAAFDPERARACGHCRARRRACRVAVRARDRCRTRTRSKPLTLWRPTFFIKFKALCGVSGASAVKNSFKASPRAVGLSFFIRWAHHSTSGMAACTFAAKAASMGASDMLDAIAVFASAIIACVPSAV